MSKAKFEAARELINEKKYNEARAILRTTDHPQAKEWLAKIDKLDPPMPAFPIIPDPGYGQVAPLNTANERAATGKGWSIWGMTLVIIVIAGFIFVFTNQSSPKGSQSTTTTSPTASKVELSTKNANATNIALPPTEPPPPTDTPPLGTRGNPYPIGQIANIRDGRYQINGLLRSQDAAVKEMNMFNTEAKSGEEWMLINATFYCDLPADKTCNTTVMAIELVGDQGQVYEHQLLAVLDNSLTGEVFGGGSKTGLIGFIAKSKDANMLVAVNDLGSRIFFKAE